MIRKRQTEKARRGNCFIKATNTTQDEARQNRAIHRRKGKKSNEIILTIAQINLNGPNAAATGY